MIKASLYRILLNPGFIFVILFIATGIVIIKHVSRGEVEDISSAGKKTLGSMSDTLSDDKSGKDGSDKSTGIVFKDVTLESGIEFFHTQGGKMLNAISEVIGSGACMADYDNDGFVDIYSVNGAGYTHYYGKKWWWSKDPYNTLYHNNGDGTFTDVTEKAGVGDKGWGMGCAFSDYDNDGNPDLYVTNYGANVLYHNNGDGTFTNVTEKAGVGDEGWGTSIAWGDYDNDGNLDLYIANYLVFDKTMNPGEPNSAYKIDMPLLMDAKLFEGQRNVLYRNNGDGTFMDVTDQAGVGNSPGKSMGVVFSDVNNDGNQDIYITNDKSRNVLYLNNGNGNFTDIGGKLGVDSPMSGMAAAIGDYDNDGDMDIFSTYTQEDTNILYKNTILDGRGQSGLYTHNKFVNATMDAGLGEDVSVGYFGWGADFFDYDNDGHLDIFVANGHGMPDFDNPRSTIGQKNQLFRNNGDGSFLEVSGSVGYGLRPMDSSRGVTMGDYDNDGDIDLFIVNNNTYASLLKNEGGNAGNWLNIKLKGTRSNRDAIGAKVKVITGTVCQTKEVRSGSGYLSQSDMRLNFGLGSLDKADSVEIRWPSGIIESFKKVKSNQFVAIVEGDRKFSVVEAVKKAGYKHLPGTESLTKHNKEFMSSEVRQQALSALGKTGDERALKALLKCLQDEDTEVRREAVKALKHFDNDRAIGPIIIAMEDSDVGVRREAIATLGFLMKEEQTIRKSSVERKRLAIAPLIMALEDEDSVVRQEAIRALGFSESYRACIPVTRVLDDTNKEVRRDAALTLGLLRDKRAIQSLIRVLRDNDEDASVRATAIISLNRLDSDIIVEPLIKALNDDDRRIRQKAASVFIALLENEEGVVFKKKPSIEPLLSAMNDNDPMVRIEVIKAIGLIKERQFNSYLIKALSDNDDGVKQMAVKAISTIGDKEALSRIEDAMQDKNCEVRKEATMAFSVLKGRESIPYLVNMLDDSSIEVKRQAIISLGSFKNRKVINVLLGVIKNKDEDARVRLSALSSLVKINKDPAMFIDLLEDDNYEIRKEAVRCLGVLKDERAIEPLSKKIVDGNNEVRRETVLALGSFKNNRVFDTLVKVLLDKDEDDTVRSGAIQSLCHFGNRKALLNLIKVLKNRGDNVRLDVIIALGGFNDELAFKHLMMIIKNRHEDTLLRTKAVMAISQMGSENVVDTLISLIHPKGVKYRCFRN
ncbi:sister chromatid cohesion protein PDS5 [Candidatus Scalindua japonica]|nr:sister chromatid cohesion protein PDS5 [Candidatus Scalindua japonica]